MKPDGPPTDTHCGNNYPTMKGIKMTERLSRTEQIDMIGDCVKLWLDDGMTDAQRKASAQNLRWYIANGTTDVSGNEVLFVICATFTAEMTNRAGQSALNLMFDALDGDDDGLPWSASHDTGEITHRNSGYVIDADDVQWFATEDEAGAYAAMKPAAEAVVDDVMTVEDPQHVFNTLHGTGFPVEPIKVPTSAPIEIGMYGVERNIATTEAPQWVRHPAGMSSFYSRAYRQFSAACALGQRVRLVEYVDGAA